MTISNPETPQEKILLDVLKSIQQCGGMVTATEIVHPHRGAYNDVKVTITFVDVTSEAMDNE